MQLDKYSVFGEVAITVDSADISNKSRRKKQLEAQEMMTQARQDICDKDDQWKGQLAKGVAFKVEVFDTGTARGWGVRALQDIPENKAVMEYVGELVSRTDIKQREDRYLHEVEGTYVFDLPLKRGSRPSWVVDATRVGNAGLHSRLRPSPLHPRGRIAAAAPGPDNFLHATRAQRVLSIMAAEAPRIWSPPASWPTRAGRSAPRRSSLSGLPPLLARAAPVPHPRHSTATHARLSGLRKGEISCWGKLR